MNFTDEQERVLNAPETRISLIAAAGSGKTATMTEKVRRLIQSGEDPESIAVITFTRLAAQEMRDRLSDIDISKLFIGTIHSLAASFVSKHGDGEKIATIAEDESFDKLFELCKGYNLKYTYKWLILDEGQDTGKKELFFLFDSIDPSCFFVVWDPRQTIYQFKGVDPMYLKQYLIARNAKEYRLNKNFRCGSSILSYAKPMLLGTGFIDNSIAMNPNRGFVYEYNAVNENIINQIMIHDNYKDWVFLTRMNKNVELIQKELKKLGFETTTFKQGGLTQAQLDKIMNEDKIKVLTQHSAKGLEFKNVIVCGAFWRGNDSRHLNYVSATRAIDRLYWIKKIKFEKF